MMKLDDLFFFFVVILIGYVASWLRLLPPQSESVFPRLLMNICYPALIIKTLTQIPLEAMFQSGLFAVMATLVITLSLYFLSGAVVRKEAANRQAQLRLQLGIGNVVYITIPLLGALFGSQVMFVAIMHSVTQDILIWTLYYPLTLRLSCGQTEKTLLRLFKSPCILALVLALILRFASLELPGPVNYTVGRLSDMVAPAALVYMGFLLHRYGLFKWARDSVAIRYALVKTVAIPLLVTGLLLTFADTMTALVLGILFASSAPTVSIVWAEGHDGDLPLAINCFLSSTLLHILLTLLVGFAFLKTGILA